MYKIFINDKPLYLVNKYSYFNAHEPHLLLNYHGHTDISYGVQALEEQEHVLSLMIFNKDLDTLWETFKNGYTIIEAAGGLVKNERGEHLLIFRNGKWDLPKGKIEHSEAADTAALREVEEECGISGLKIDNELPSTFHTYRIDELAVLKETHWYSMTYSGSEPLIPQLDEGIEKAEWMNEELRLIAAQNVYASIDDVLSEID